MEPEEEIEEDIQLVSATETLPKYIPLQKGRVKVPKGLDTVMSTLNTLFLPEGVLFEGTVVGHVSTINFEDWDLADTKKFPHLETSELMEQSTEGVVTTLQPRAWLHGVEEVGLLHLLSIPHFHRPSITIFVIRQLLFLVHDGYLWLEEPIPIIVELIHRISWLPYSRRDPMEIASTGGDLTLARL